MKNLIFYFALCILFSCAEKRSDNFQITNVSRDYQTPYFEDSARAEKILKYKSVIDSVFSKSKDMDFSQFNFGINQPIDYRFNLILLLSRIGGKDLNAMSNNFLAEIIEGNKFNGVISKTYGIAEEGNFYRAKTSLPSTLTETEELISRSFILWQACRKKEAAGGANNWKAMDEFLTHDFNYVFYLPN